jgi:tetratricopeptide (TPR) repeat protein
MLDFDLLWDYAHPAATEIRFRELLDSHHTDLDYRLQLLTQIARAQGLQHQFEFAHETLNRVELALNERIPTAAVRYLLERGRLLNTAGQPGEAQPWFQTAYDAARSITTDPDADFYAVDALHMQAIIADPDAALEWNLHAVSLAEQSTSERARSWLGSLYNNIGWTYHDLGEYDRALAIFEKALGWRIGQGKPEEIHIARWCVARTLRSLNRLEEAVLVLEELDAHDGYVAEELGECALQMGQPHQNHFAQAYNLLSQDQWLVTNEPERLARLKLLGDVPD